MDKLLKGLFALPVLVVLAVVGYFLWKKKKPAAAPGVAPAQAPGALTAPATVAPAPKAPPSVSEIQQATQLISAGGSVLNALGNLFGGSDDSNVIP